MNSTQPEANNVRALERKIRLKKLLEEGQEIEEKISKQTSDNTLHAISNIIIGSDAILAESKSERLRDTGEVVMDVQLLKMNHELVSNVMDQNTHFNEYLYTNAISRLVKSDRAADWNVIAEKACNICKTVQVKATMLGAIQLEQKPIVVKERQQRKRQTLGEATRPDYVQEMKRQDKGAQKVNYIYKQINKMLRQNRNATIPFWKLVIDPDNFMNTIDNSFQVAFMVRDGLVAIESGEDNLPQLRIATAEERNRDVNGLLQSVCTLKMEKCRNMIDYYKITEPMLKSNDCDDDDDEVEEDDEDVEEGTEMSEDSDN